MKNYTCLNPDCGKYFDEPLAIFGHENCPYCHTSGISDWTTSPYSSLNLTYWIPKYRISKNSDCTVVYFDSGEFVCLCVDSEVAQNICDTLNHQANYILPITPDDENNIFNYTCPTC